MTASQPPPSLPAISANPLPTPVATRPTWIRSGRGNSDVLGIGWFHGSLYVATFKKGKLAESWVAQTAIRTLQELEPALDEALTVLNFAGTEVFLLLENAPFVHQMENAPAISEAAARNYLKNRVDRYEKEHEPMLWVSQKSVPGKQDASYLLHLLPTSFYDTLNRMLVARRLVLARILPLVVPVQRELDRYPITKGRPVLVAVETGGATTIMVAQVGGQILFARTILASWSADPGRIGLEINRSALYANQQYNLTVERIWLLGQDNHSTALVNEKCGTGKQITVLPTTPVEWLQSAAKISARHPVNLVAGYLKRKRQIFYTRAGIILAGWLIFSVLALNSWREAQSWAGEKQHLAGLVNREASLTKERDDLIARNALMEQQRVFVKQAEDDRLPPVAESFLTYVAGVLPPTVRLSDFNVKLDEGSGTWSFRFEGTVEADEDTAREILSTVQKQMSRGPLRVKGTDGMRAVIPTAVAPGGAPSETQRFVMEGTMLEN